MTDEHPFIADIPAFALGALDPKDAAILERHLQTCDICQAELTTYRALAEGLLVASPPRQPPAALRRKLQQRLPSAQKVIRPRQAWSFSFGQMALAFALILLVALNLVTLMQMQSFQRQQTQLARQVETGQTALALLAYPETQSLPISGSAVAGTVLLDKERNVAVVLVWNLPRLQPNQVFQLWLTDAQGKRSSAGIFNAQEDVPFTSVQVLGAGSLSNFNALGVTVEPSGGSPQPTGARVFKVDF